MLWVPTDYWRVESAANACDFDMEGVAQMAVLQPHFLDDLQTRLLYWTYVLSFNTRLP